jgi:hypothetical protein
MHRILLVPTLAAAFTLGACGNNFTSNDSTVVEVGPPQGLRIGETTTVAIRPDMLGGSMELPVDVRTASLNGARLTLEGELVVVDATWIVLDEGGTRRWIRLETVLRIEQATPTSPPSTGG